MADRSVKFSEMKYVRPDADRMIPIFEALAEKIAQAKTFEEYEGYLNELDEEACGVSTMSALAYIHGQLDSTDEYYKQENAACNDYFIKSDPSYEKAKKALLDSPFAAALEEKYGKLMIQKLRGVTVTDDAETSADKREYELTKEYRELIDSGRIEFEGKTFTQHELLDAKHDDDDERRFAAWCASGACYAQNNRRLDEIFDELVKVRTKKAHDAGYADYVDMAYVLRGRTCFDKHDIARFRDAVVKYYVPIQVRLAKQQAERLGKTYPLNFADDNLPFRGALPHPIGTKEQTLQTALQIWREMSPETAEFADYFEKYQVFDTSESVNKSGGGFVIDLLSYDSFFLFSHFTGTISDVNSISHEGGHAFAAYMNRGKRPTWQHMYTQEIAETHSQAMEYLFFPYEERFFGDKADAYRYSHVLDAFSFIPYACLVDHFQQIVYEKPEMTPEERIETFKELSQRYTPWKKMGEIPFYGDGRQWQRQPHIYTSPFYFIDYCISELLALQFFALERENQQEAIRKYISFVKQGGSKDFVQLALDAGLQNPLSEEGLRYCAGQIVPWLDSVDISDLK